MAGYIKLHRGWRDTDGLTPSTHYSDWEAWIWLLENAAWKPRTRFNAKGEEIRLERGQLHLSVRALCTAWGWSRKRVCTFLDRIERVSKVVTKRGQSGTILTICKYDEYQSNGDSQGDSRGTVGGQSGDTQEEGKEGKKENKIVALARVSCPSGVSQSVWADFTALRKAKRAPITPTVVDALTKEAAKAGWSLEAALTECVSRGWQSFKADWVKRRADEEEMTMPC